MAKHVLLQTLRAALARLRAYEQRWIDLSYPAGDPRAVIPDNEQPQYVINERDRLRRDVVIAAALVGGESPEAARMFADAPLAADNPYNVTRARVASTLHWPIPESARLAANARLRARVSEQPALDVYQATLERLVL